jgi:hypothetical protein
MLAPMKLLAGLAVTAALLFTTGCFGAGHPPADSGIVGIVGRAGPVKIKGTITALKDGKEIASRAIAAGAHFTMLLPPGAYAVKATIDQAACPDTTATVPEHSFTKIEMAC